MRIHFSDKKPLIAVAGHAGSGHCHSHNLYLQEDSGGLATALTLFQEATGLSLTIGEVACETGINGSITVRTVSGGVGVCSPRRGVTMQEARLAKSLEGRDAIRTQSLAMEAFGRFYGQGVHEAPVALQTAIANAAVDSFIKNYPGKFAHGIENIAHCCGKMAGAVLEYDGIPFALLATVNATPDGTGPVEDLEGNAIGGSKKKVMERLGMTELPTIVVEGKVYTPAYSDNATEPYFLFRADRQDDNPFVAEAMLRAGKNIGYAAVFRDDVMQRAPGALEKTTKALGDAIIAAGNELKEARFSQDKVAILARLARLVSEDGAGISFMSDRLHEIIGGTGIMPGMGAVMSYVVPKSYRDAYIFPFLTEDDMTRYAGMVKETLRELLPVLPEAAAHLKKYAYKGDLDALLKF